MSACDSCPIEEKIHVCCARYPRTGEQRAMKLESGATMQACPHLAFSGACSIYSTRPEQCRRFFCERFGRDDTGANAGQSTGFMCYRR